MRIVLINLKHASERRARMAREFGALGLEYEIKEAIDGRHLTEEHLEQVDRQGRRLLGLYPQANGSIANWLTQREAMADLVANGPDMMAIFEDDARLTPELPEVLAVLEQKRFAFDVVVLQRRHPKRPFIPAFPAHSASCRRTGTLLGQRLGGLRHHTGGRSTLPGNHAEDGSDHRSSAVAVLA